MKEARDLTPQEIKQVQEYFGKDNQVNRIINNIAAWKSEER